jgi:uncharacterized protein
MTIKPSERAKRPPTASVREAPFRLVRDTTVDGQPNDGLTLDGYGAVFNSPTIIDSWEGRFKEIIAPGSMRKSFRETPPRIQYDHGRHPLIGSIPIASLKSVSEDTDPVLAPDGGAHVVGRIFDNWLMQPVRDAIASDPPAINGMSFRFEVVREAWTYADGTPIKNDTDLMAELDRTYFGGEDIEDDDLPIRTMKELKVPEIGPVMWPAYEATSVSVRNKVIDLGRLHEPEQRKLLARAVFMADNAAGQSRDTSIEDDGNDDEQPADPAALAGSLDAILDQAGNLIPDDLSTVPTDVAQVYGLINAANDASDKLLNAMGVYDPDKADDENSADENSDNTDDDQPRSKNKAAQDVRGKKDVDAPQTAGDKPVGEHPSRENDAPQSTGSKPVGEHPSKNTHLQGMEISLRTVRGMLEDINQREAEND